MVQSTHPHDVRHGKAYKVPDKSCKVATDPAADTKVWSETVGFLVI